MIRHLNKLQNDHNNKSSNHLSPYKVITVFLTAFLMLYFACVTYLFYNWKSVVLIPFSGDAHFEHNETIVSEGQYPLCILRARLDSISVERVEKNDTCQKMNNLKIAHYGDSLHLYSLRLNSLFKTGNVCN